MNTYHLLRKSAAFSAMAILAVASPASADGVDAGTLIENTASATYDAGGGPQTIQSNTVTVRVDELLDVTITSLDASSITTTPGEAVLAFEITNTGNGREAFFLQPDATVAGNDFDVTVDSIAVDTNGNGVYDPGVDEILTAAQRTKGLVSDGSLTVFVIVTVPDTVTDGQQTSVNLTATAVTGSGAPGDLFAGKGAGGGDAIVGTTGATATATGSLEVGISTVDLTKSATIVDPFGGSGAVPGSIVTFTIVAQVSGSGSVDDLVVADTIPDGTTFVAGTLSLDGNALTDAPGDDAGQASDAAGISVDLGTVAAPGAYSIAFDVIID